MIINVDYIISLFAVLGPVFNFPYVFLGFYFPCFAQNSHDSFSQKLKRIHLPDRSCSQKIQMLFGTLQRATRPHSWSTLSSKPITSGCPTLTPTGYANGISKACSTRSCRGTVRKTATSSACNKPILSISRTDRHIEHGARTPQVRTTLHRGMHGVDFDGQ